MTAIAATGCASHAHQKAAEHHGKPMHGEHYKHKDGKHHKDGQYHKDGKHHKDGKYHKDGKHPHGKKFEHGKDFHAMHGYHGKGQQGKYQHAVDMHKSQFSCDANAVIETTYLPNDDKAILNITAPSWQLANQTIEFKAAPTASGMRFVNETNPTSPYAWHAKGADSILSVTVNGKEHSLNCQEIKKQA